MQCDNSKRFILLLLPFWCRRRRLLVAMPLLSLGLFHKSRALQSKIPVAAAAAIARLSTTTTTVTAAAQQRHQHRRLQNEGRYRRIQELLLLQQQRSRELLLTLTPAESLELKALQDKGDPYNARLFSAEHASFKNAHNRAFVALAQHCHDYNKRHKDHSSSSTSSNNSSSSNCGPVLYLDGADGGTTRALLAAGWQHHPEQLCLVNEWPDSVHQLLTTYQDVLVQGQNIHCGRLQNMSMSKLVVVGSNNNDDDDDVPPPFCAVYLDGCGGATRVGNAQCRLFEPPLRIVVEIAAGQGQHGHWIYLDQCRANGSTLAGSRARCHTSCSWIGHWWW
jgi:hypothetical protein